MALEVAEQNSLKARPHELNVWAKRGIKQYFYKATSRVRQEDNLGRQIGFQMSKGVEGDRRWKTKKNIPPFYFSLPTKYPIGPPFLKPGGGGGTTITPEA